MENLFEQTMKENFLNLLKELDMQSRKLIESQRSCIQEETPKHIIKLFKIKDKERILKAEREKETVPYKGVPIRLSADFSKETLKARRDWKEVFDIMKGKDLHPRLLYPAKISFRMEGQIKSFTN